MTYEQKLEAVKQANADKLSYSMVADKLECTRCAISGFVWRNRDHIGIWHQSPFILGGYPVQRKRRPPTPPPVRKRREFKPAKPIPKEATKGQRMVAMAKAGFSNRHIANQCEATMDNVRETLSYYRRKGEDISESAERPYAEDPIEMVEVDFLDRRKNQCAWPLWEDGDDHKNCCGNPVDDEQHYTGSYCRWHREISRSEWFASRRKVA